MVLFITVGDGGLEGLVGGADGEGSWRATSPGMSGEVWETEEADNIYVLSMPSFIDEPPKFSSCMNYKTRANTTKTDGWKS